MLKKIFVIILLLCSLTACSNEKTKNPIVTMDIENYGEIKIELYPEYAPNTVANFVNLVEQGFYDDNSFHRLVPGFVLQGGDPDGTGIGGPGYKIKGEFKQNNFPKNTLSHSVGVISMARQGDPYNDAAYYNTAGSQFFIVLSDNVKSSLDNKYAGFGKVIEGMELIKKIEETEKVEDVQSGKLKTNIKINKATVDTFGKTYKVVKAN